MTKHLKLLKNLSLLHLCCHFLTLVSLLDYVPMPVTKVFCSYCNSKPPLALGWWFKLDLNFSLMQNLTMLSSNWKYLLLIGLTQNVTCSYNTFKLSQTTVTDPSHLTELEIHSQPCPSMTEIWTKPLPHHLDDLNLSAQEDTEYQQLQHFILHEFHAIINNYQMPANHTWTFLKASPFMIGSLFMAADSSFPQNRDVQSYQSLPNPIRVLLE